MNQSKHAGLETQQTIDNFFSKKASNNRVDDKNYNKSKVNNVVTPQGTMSLDMEVNQRAHALKQTPLVNPQHETIEEQNTLSKSSSLPIALDAARGIDEAHDQGFMRCGTIAIIGKPNVGKSTLLNALVKQKISITSRKAQTTRHRIMGVYTQGQTQYVFVDTPGFQTKYGNALNRSLNKTVQGSLDGIDLVFWVVEAGGSGSFDAIIALLSKTKVPVVLIANKLDLIKEKKQLLPWIQSVQSKYAFAHIVPLCAKNTKDIQRLLALCEPYLPKQEWLYDKDMVTDKSERFWASEIIREKLFRLTGDELPYSSTIVIDCFAEECAKAPHKRFVKINATIIVERDSHKAMIIGDRAQRIKAIGTQARIALEHTLEAKVFLELWVKVRAGWSDDQAHVRSFGYE